MTDLTTAESLEAIARNSRYAEGVNTATILYAFRIFARHIRGATLLELGPAEGVMTRLLHELGLQTTIVEGSRSFADALAERYPEADVHCSLFEQWEAPRTFDNIVLGHVLEHVDDPADILARCKGWLAPGGRILAAVPNARSVHRQAAVNMGLLEHEAALNEADIHHGHKRVYDPEGFRRDFNKAGLHIDLFGGYWLKPLSNSQIERDWTPQMVQAFMEVGERYPDIAAEIYVVASAPG